MTKEFNEFDSGMQEMEAKLSRVKVAAPSLDANVIFYEAGFAAASSQHQRQLSWNRRLATAGVLVGVCLSSLASYRAGQSSQRDAHSMITIAKAPSPKTAEVVADERPKTNNESLLPTVEMSNQVHDATLIAADDPGDTWLTTLFGPWLQPPVQSNVEFYAAIASGKDPLDSRLQIASGNSAGSDDRSSTLPPRSSLSDDLGLPPGLRTSPQPLQWKDFFSAL